MRFRVTYLLLGLSLGAGCGSGQHAPAVSPRTTLALSVEGQAESSECQGPVTRESTCIVTMTARVELGELEGRDWQLGSLQSVVRDGRSGENLEAAPGTLTSDDIRRVAGSSTLAKHGRLTIPVALQFVVGQPPFYIDGPHELHVTIVAKAL